MSEWTCGDNSTVYRFKKSRDGAHILTLEFEVFDQGETIIRTIPQPGQLPSESKRFENILAALNYAREEWGLTSESLPDSPTVRVQRLVLSLLADYVGTQATFGHDVPAETRDALAAAYEALDETGLPLTFHDCPHDGAALTQLPEDSDLPPQIEPLECPECGEVFHLDRDTGELEAAA